MVDVASAAGVSAGTVSNTISGKRKVNSQTRARIDKAIRELDYVPNLAARGMRTGRANTLAIYSSMPSAMAPGSARLGFLMEIAASVAVSALEHNWRSCWCLPSPRPAPCCPACPLTAC
ncbi:putative lacI-family transcriptional regulator [Citreicella sp. 357]|nr:putative lacI-family transcriptional regulator [Citreicella sp. 357]